MNKFLDELIERHKYVVRVTKDINEGVLDVNYAEKLETSYTFSQLGGPISYFWYLNVSEVNAESSWLEECVFLPTYLVRLYVLCDIYRTCNRLDISTDTIRFYATDGGYTDLLQLLPVDLDKDGADREKLLNAYMVQVMFDRERLHEFDAELEKVGLLHSFNILKGLLIE